MLYRSLSMLYTDNWEVEHNQTTIEHNQTAIEHNQTTIEHNQTSVEHNQTMPEWKYEYALPSFEGIFACRAKSI